MGVFFDRELRHPKEMFAFEGESQSELIPDAHRTALRETY